jgi:hypothetical protein
MGIFYFTIAVHIFYLLLLIHADVKFAELNIIAIHPELFFAIKDHNNI